MLWLCVTVSKWQMRLYTSIIRISLAGLNIYKVYYLKTIIIMNDWIIWQLADLYSSYSKGENYGLSFSWIILIIYHNFCVIITYCREYRI